MQSKHISVVIPVYGDPESLKNNLRSARKFHRNDSMVDFYYINDLAPNGVAKTMRDCIVKLSKEIKNFHYFENPEHLGYLKTCNYAVFNIVPKSDDVFLLNSDTVLTKGAIQEMREVLYSKQKFAAVSPRSNRAWVWSVPVNGKYQYEPNKAYKLFKKNLKTIPRYYIHPSIHGFCVLIKRSVINKCGLYDEIYDEGYCEENDFAMRVKERGFVNVCANHAFVFHVGRRSFGVQRRNQLITRNRPILLERYPNVYREIVEFTRSIDEPIALEIE